MFHNVRIFFEASMATIRIKSDMSGMVSKIVVQVGSQVTEDDTLILLESMKMEIPVTAPRAGRVVEISAIEPLPATFRCCASFTSLTSSRSATQHAVLALCSSRCCT